LIDAGLVHPLPVEAGSSAKAEDTFYLVEVGAGPQSVVSPFELLQAFQPQGIISFFSALSYHGLTTQTPPFYHSVALTPRPPAAAPERATPDAAITLAPSIPAAHRDSLGSHAFTYAGARYFSTKRFRDLVPGVQTRIIDPRIHLRVTDIEQTLLDTLMNPEASGSQSVIFEAWERGLDRARPERLAGYLQTIALPVLVRRLGALLNLTGAVIPAPLRSVLEQTRGGLAVDSAPQVPLFRGQSGDRFDPEWNVLTPA
jgi:predicted transcriptional regulator of viral defense system